MLSAVLAGALVSALVGAPMPRASVRSPHPKCVASDVASDVARQVARNIGTPERVKPSFPEVCDQTGITLTRYMCEVARANPDLQDLEALISSIQTACKTINSLVQRSHLTGLVGYADSINVQGEEQKVRAGSTRVAAPTFPAECLAAARRARRRWTS